MKLAKEREYRLARPPTCIASVNGNVYVSTKCKRLFYLPSDSRQLKSILFTSPVTSVCRSDSVLYCGCESGRLFGLDSRHKTVFRAETGNEERVNCCVYSAQRESIFVASNGPKILEFGQNSILKNAFYCQGSRTTQLALQATDRAAADRAAMATMDSTAVALVQENILSVKLLNILSKEVTEIGTAGAFPEAVCFLSDRALLVGLLSGAITCWARRKSRYERQSAYECPDGSAVCAIMALPDGLFIAGFSDFTVRLFRMDQTGMACLDRLETPGLPVAFCGHGGAVAVAVSREQRLGRWGRCHTSKAKNRLWMIRIEAE